jgi:phosphatidylserine decarboxylase
LSVFDVHINRAPAAGRVAWIEYRPGQFLNALRAESSARNEANLVGLEIDGGRMRMLVKQIAGVIARRIVCPVKPGDTLQRGQRFGMIKFGSRTEVYVPQRCVERIDVKIGQHIRAGSTVVGVLR